ncbi:MAG: thioredoxin domain-containing protein [Gammaproteobacteria bacterium]|nr:thioredoxin domain-containing protein [Gammaproteobacteria bacterium]MBU1489986.1 thioredoxin domain-containing protein [Gammaproteobacteria bacterium]MBU2064251.1 thioredoxin domain-containing protein [Gammaproteobacteria bacterium]MBU2137888.1 thioredoxin domain-containing protein [Gammaproteobacteria bacterium]MBU2325573.1 thioredoxin domain-containing protein [Gammaproteobacteria bacterium]
MSRRALVVVITLIAVIGFALAALFYPRQPVPSYQPGAQATQTVEAPSAQNLVRFHSPSFGPADARVTVVEFFDPSCEACRAFYPIVKQIMDKHPKDIRVVIRYVLNHKGSEEAARIIEAARKQNLFVPVLEALLDSQPAWHDDAQVMAGWEATERAGLGVQKAREQMNSADIDAALSKDAADAQRLGVRGTPTFFVNGRALTQFGAQPLYDLIRSEIDKPR